MVASASKALLLVVLSLLSPILVSFSPQTRAILQDAKVVGTVTKEWYAVGGIRAIDLRVDWVLLSNDPRIGPSSVAMVIPIEDMSPLVFCFVPARIDEVHQGDKVEAYGVVVDAADPSRGTALAIQCDPFYIIKRGTTFSVWTDKSTYLIGETVTIHMQPTPAFGVKYWLIIVKPDNSQVRIDLSPGQGTVTTNAVPAGRHMVQLWGQLVVANPPPPGLLDYCFFDVVAELGVKFRGLVWNEPSQQPPRDIAVKIGDVLLDPERKLSAEDLAHVDIAEYPSICEVDWPLHKGNSVEVYAKHYRYGYTDFTGTYAIGVWIYSKVNPLDGHIKLAEVVCFRGDVTFVALPDYEINISEVLTDGSGILRVGVRAWVDVWSNRVLPPIKVGDFVEVRGELPYNADPNKPGIHINRDFHYIVKFFPKRDGYSFRNWKLDEQSWDEMKTSIETMLSYVKQHEPWLWPILPLLYFWYQKGGHCYGMASTSILYYLNQISRPSGCENTQVYNWSRPVAQQAIEDYQARQFDRIGERILKDFEWLFSGGFDASKEYAAVKNSIDNGRPIMLIMTSPTSNHAVTAIGYMESGMSKIIQLYDNESPGKVMGEEIKGADLAVVDGKSFRYLGYDRFFATAPSAAWAASDTLAALLWRIYELLWRQLSKSGQILATIHCPANLTVTDQFGRRAGYINGAYVNEIPGCRVDSGIGLQIFYLPSNLAYQMKVEALGDGLFNVGVMSSRGTASYAKIPISKQSRCYLQYNAASPATSMQVDQNGDGTIERTVQGNFTSAEKGNTRIEFDASPKPGYVDKAVNISGTMYGSWHCIRNGVVVYKPVTITTGWGFSKTVTTDYFGQFSVPTICPSTAGTYPITATFYEDQDLTGSSATIQYQVIAKVPTSITIGYIGNRQFGGYLRRTDTGAYLAYKPVKLSVTYLSGTAWRTDTFDLQTRHDGYWNLEFLFYWSSATITFGGDETYASSTATISRSGSAPPSGGSVAPPKASSASKEASSRFVLDASPKPGYINKPVNISGVMYGSWRCIKDGMVVGKPVEVVTGWGFSKVLTTDYYGRFSVITNCPSQGGTYPVTATFYEDQDLAASSTTISYEVIAKIPTTITISYVGNREFGGYLRRADTGAYLAYKPVKLTATYLSGTTWRTDSFDLQTRQDGYYSLEFLFYWNSATIAFEGDETYASSQATITR